MGKNYAVQGSDKLMMVIRVLNAQEDGDNGYYEQCAIGHNGDNLELIILSRGNGCGDDRVLCDHDEDETISPDVLREAAKEIEAIASDLASDGVSAEDYYDLAEYVIEQANFIEEETENE